MARNSSFKAQVLGGMPYAGETGKLTEWWRGCVDETYAFSRAEVVYYRAALSWSTIGRGIRRYWRAVNGHLRPAFLLENVVNSRLLKSNG